MKNIAVFASYNGSAVDTIYKAIENKELDLNLALIITNNSDANVIKKAQKLHIPFFIVNEKLYEDVDSTIEKLLIQNNCENIFLAGYMKKVSPNLTNKFNIINSHPALLPKFGGKGMYGKYVHEAVIKSGEKSSGVTVHYVNENYDEGTIILQNSLEINKNETTDSLEVRIKVLEQITILEAFKKIFN
jgi:phosphoribosylglycinamide formyltransferase-1